MHALNESMGRILAQIPECRCKSEVLCHGAEIFGVDTKSMLRAAEELSGNHDLKYEGIRKLLALCLEEFAAIFSEHEVQRCEVSVPAPSCAMFALQRATNRMEFVSQAFFAQIVLRGIFLHREPIDLSSCAKRRCGLNKMREKLFRECIDQNDRNLLQFGVLCDECTKSGESLEGINQMSFFCPKGELDEKRLCGITEQFAKRLRHQWKLLPNEDQLSAAMRLYGRLVKAQKQLLILNNRENRMPLMGNSLALAQSVLLMTSPRIERFVDALELLVQEMESAPQTESGKRFYCFYIPFLQPEVERRFRENGVTLLGNGAFLEYEKCVGFDVPRMISAWLRSMSLRMDSQKQSAVLEKAIRESHCSMYISGAFAFDRWLGSNMPLTSKYLAEKGIPSRTIEADFWCENVMFGNVFHRIDQLCLQ